ncbi:tyrosine-protein phosphatase [endosymbiont of unidentified scaly snail isolate Monju]|uniref:tyrosine-protein phosphatase n=1 Tax=endosymbiont of unidentified scaly snail isolate Monju TaxID=1248727 RepID=UPI0003891F6E|nr:CpsB/CapC family capsule biosynthesis tyrosine phosphatase [endosymbiont of unidentified scaly snail isolate Monju]BAN68620.1 protein-tyrosine phosphatase [endosymbiont of unidentified scaly snail isolate Monju]
MIDLHCHLLPGIDDGAKDLDEALALARVAVDAGICHAVMTPHVHPGRYDNHRDGIAAACEDFQQALDAAGIALRVSPGAEVRVSDQVVLQARQGVLPTIGEWEGRPVVLLEFPHSHIPPGSEKLTAFLLRQGYQPMIAHPERNKDVIRRFEKIHPFFEQGCLLQVTAAAVTGGFGSQALKRAWQLLERGWVTVLASDAHNLHARPPDMRPGFKAVCERLDETTAWSLVRDNPARICGLA